MDITTFKLKTNILLHHDGACYLLGMAPDRTIYIEEYYDETFIAQHQLAMDGRFLQTVDENFGQQAITPLSLPENSREVTRPLTHPLQYKGLRRRGIRENDKVAEWVKPLPIIEKMPLLQTLQLRVPPMMILGIAESKVLSETTVSEIETIVCREIHLLRALPEIQHDATGLPYDYDTITFNVIHPYNITTDSAPPLHEALNYFPAINSATDCFYIGDRLIVTDSGGAGSKNCVHIFVKTQDENPTQ